ncbi:MAG: Uma2 family endonuclease [Planctomycetaceae bacterium]|nr:Uma2 family endonuclease [Planctomycetaceae bacterium]
MSTITHPLTPDDVLAMPDGDRYELVNGELKERQMSELSSWVAGKIIRLLGPFEDQGAGWIFPEGTSYQCFPWDPLMFRRADASFIARNRRPDGPTGSGHIRIAPDLAAEVVSPHDSLYDVEAKVADYLEAGVQVVWVVNPDRRTITIHRLSDPSAPTRLKETDELCGEGVLEGFRCRVGDLFPPAVHDKRRSAAATQTE